MTGVSHQAIIGSGVRRASMIETITGLGLTSGLQLCLDAGDAASYTSGQTFTDLSGNANHYYRGTGSGSDSGDGTFNGVAGARSSAEYFSSDGGDNFAPTAAHTYAANWHKDNAEFSLTAWVWVPAGVASPPGYPLFSTRGAATATDRGVSVQLSGLASTGRVGINYGNGSSVQQLNPPTNDTIIEAGWMFLAVSFDEGSGASFARMNGTVELFSSDSYISPTASAAADSPVIWQTASTPVVAPNGARLANIAMWSRALTQAEVTSLYDSTKAKFGL